MRKIVLEKDYGKKETFEKWNGKFLDDSSYDKVYKVTQKEDLGIMKPVRSLDDAYPMCYDLAQQFGFAEVCWYALNGKRVTEGSYTDRD